MRRITYICSIALSLSLSLSISAAEAHVRWNPAGSTPPRTDSDAIKTGPCGAPRGSDPAVFAPGTELEVQFESTIFHQGEFRIAFSPAGDADFDDYVLADGIADIEGQRDRSYTITLPDITCEACTLQLIQSMPDRTPTTYYYSCADIALRAAPTPDPLPVAPIEAAVEVDGEGVWLRWTAGQAALWVVAPAPVDFNPVAGAQYLEGDSVGNGEVVHVGEAGAVRYGLAPGAYYFAAYGVSDGLSYSSAQAVGPVTVAANPAPPGTTTGGSGLWLSALLAVVAGSRARFGASRKQSQS